MLLILVKNKATHATDFERSLFLGRAEVLLWIPASPRSPAVWCRAVEESTRGTNFSIPSVCWQAGFVSTCYMELFAWTPQRSTLHSRYAVTIRNLATLCFPLRIQLCYHSTSVSCFVLFEKVLFFPNILFFTTFFWHLNQWSSVHLRESQYIPKVFIWHSTNFCPCWPTTGTPSVHLHKGSEGLNMELSVPTCSSCLARLAMLHALWCWGLWAAFKKFICDTNLHSWLHLMPTEPLPGATVIGFIAETHPQTGSFLLIALQGMGWSDLN